MNEPNTFFDYDGALADLREMYERGRRWIAANIGSTEVTSKEFIAVYKHTLELTFAMMSFREAALLPEAL